MGILLKSPPMNTINLNSRCSEQRSWHKCFYLPRSLKNRVVKSSLPSDEALEGRYLTGRISQHVTTTHAAKVSMTSTRPEHMSIIIHSIDISMLEGEP